MESVGWQGWTIFFFIASNFRKIVSGSEVVHFIIMFFMTLLIWGIWWVGGHLNENMMIFLSCVACVVTFCL